jgi:hypothetical protein
MIELVAGQYRHEDGDHANDTTRERYHRGAHRTMAVDKGMIRQLGSGSCCDERLQCKL